MKCSFGSGFEASSDNIDQHGQFQVGWVLIILSMKDTREDFSKGDDHLLKQCIE